MNVEGKHLAENGYINTSVQKGGIPGISGCLEHATIIWEAIQRAKSEKLNLDIIWLDLANAYGSVPHQMIQLALRMHHVPEDIQVMLDDYFRDFWMRFSTNSYTIDWINLKIGIAMSFTLPKTNTLIFTTEGGAKSWQGRPMRTTNRRKCLLDGCDD